MYVYENTSQSLVKVISLRKHQGRFVCLSVYVFMLLCIHLCLSVTSLNFVKLTKLAKCKQGYVFIRLCMVLCVYVCLNIKCTHFIKLTDLRELWVYHPIHLYMFEYKFELIFMNINSIDICSNTLTELKDIQTDAVTM